MKIKHTVWLLFAHLCLLYRPLNTSNEPTCIWNFPGEEINKDQGSSHLWQYLTCLLHEPFVKNFFPSPLPLRCLNITKRGAPRHTASYEDHRIVVRQQQAIALLVVTKCNKDTGSNQARSPSVLRVSSWDLDERSKTCVSICYREHQGCSTRIDICG